MTTKSMNGLEKVAVLLKSLPKDVLDKLLKHLDPRHAKMVSAELAKLGAQPDLGEKLSYVLDEAVDMLGQVGAKKQTAKSSDAPPANDAAAKPASVDIRIDAKTVAPPAPPPPPPPAPALDGDAETDPLRALALTSSDLLALALDNENSRTISLLMNHLDIEVAGQVYKRLSPAKRKEVSLRFTEQTVVGEDLIKRIAQGVLQKCVVLRNASATGTEQGGREKRIAALMRGLERTERMDMLGVLEQADAELTGRVKALLYQFEDILRMENTSVQKFLTEIDMKSLSLALRGAEPEIETKILTNLSKRAQESLKEEISLMGTVASAKVKQARQTLVEAIQRLDQRGDLVLME